MNLAIITAHAGASCLGDAKKSWACSYDDIYQFDGTKGMLKAYQEGYEYCKHDLLAFFHDDLIIKAPWISDVLDQFRKYPNLGVLGFGGAFQHGSNDIYKTPYKHTQVGRSYYISNTVDAEVHGARYDGSAEVATLDGFALIIRRQLLDLTNGWPIEHLDYIGYDYWITCMARRFNYSVRYLGINCHHLGGRTAVELKKNEDENGEKYRKAHRYIYEEFRDVLPFSARVQP